MINRLTLILLLSLTLIQCNKVKNPTNNASQSGQYFKCMINGNQWVAGTPDNPLGPSSFSVYYDENEGDLSITCTRKDVNQTYYESVSMTGSGITTAGTFQLISNDPTGEARRAFRDYVSNYPCTKYYHDSLNPGTIEITLLDTASHKIKGNFQMIAKPSFCEADNLNIQLGEFSLSY